MTKSKIILVYTFFIIFFIFILFLIKDFMSPLLISFIFAYILTPLKKHLEKRGFSSKLSAIISIIFILVVFIFIFFIIIPSIIKEVFVIASSIDIIEESLRPYFLFYDKLPAYIKGNLDVVLGKLKSTSTVYINRLFVNTILISKKMTLYLLTPIFTYYFLIDSAYFKKQIMNIIPFKLRDIVFDVAREIDEVIGNYIRGQLILSFIISLFTFIGLVLLKIRFPLFIAVINGLTNIIPYFGPVLGFAPAFLIALTQSINKAVAVSIFFFVLQEIESSIVAPKILGDSLGIHPVYVIIILLVGGKFFGGIGLLLAVPIAGIIKVTYNYLMKKIF
ncbi:AI-2E family transporter [Thermobrachium celere]|uniref:AI-2E family transporter n=1 Tax=Thermobrachium celere TaxID=53422 RepID=UPI001942BB6C|nr:AI-2E family transporter [Thermobrachium celere]GFR35754.1 AI-2E family transporter [Thermobrachium celere]